MATSVTRSVDLVCLFISFNLAATGNISSHLFNKLASGDRNVIDSITDIYASPQHSEPEVTEPSPSNDSHGEPKQDKLPADTLLASGPLLTPATKVIMMCPCDWHRGMCDMNCCCDRDCGEEGTVFTDCSMLTFSVNQQLCSHDVVSYSLASTINGYSNLEVSVTKETNYDIFCIHSQNSGFDGFSHPSTALLTDSSFDSLFKQFTSFMFDLEENEGQMPTAEVQDLPGYQFGDEILTAGERGERGLFWLSSPGVTAECVDTSPAVFLKDQSSACSRRLVLDQDCSTSPALNLHTYSNIQLCVGKDKDAEVIPLEVSSVILQSLDQTQTEVRMTAGEDLSPILLNLDLCANVVLKVEYVMRYSPEGHIVNASVSLVLGFVRGAALPLKQDFQIIFIQQDHNQAPIPLSGNPGYGVGLPLVSGIRAADVIVRSINLRDTLSLLHGAEDQDCLHGAHQRSPVLFGLDSVTGCTLRQEDIANCSLASEVLLDILRGPDYPHYVASFGNSPLNNPLDWVQVKSNFNPGEVHSCSIPVSLHFIVEWTRHGSLLNPQIQILSIKEVIQTNTTSLQSGDSSLSIRTSVAFIPMSAAAFPGFRVTPTIDAKLPFNFFYPFV
uniref:Tectonic family member 1 n=1 Tax=Echeneis naucrates TaxID=173247 RepID=A0A665VHM9_ECHNA